MSVKNLLRETLPPTLFEALRRTATYVRRQVDFCRLCLDYFRDARRYARWSHTGRGDSEFRQREFSLLKSYHGVEKGLSLAEPRPGFGQQKIRSLIDQIDKARHDASNSAVTAAATASIGAYHGFNRNQDVTIDWLDTWIEATEPVDPRLGGTETVHRDDISAAIRGVSPDFFTTRHSVRNFAAGEVPLSDIEAAVSIARKAPSVCNRQGVKVYCFTRAEEALKHQPGNTGFGHLASRGLVITADLQAFSSIGERHQAYVDGGLFAMSLVYALHSMGYGSCMLAWTQRAATEARLRAALDIPDSEAVIMMIAVGCLPETFEAARAWRRPLSDLLVVR